MVSSMSLVVLHQSNGLAEKGVQIIKRLLKKADEQGEDPYLALLSYRTTPLDCGQSPAELCMKRKLRTRLPDPADLVCKPMQSRLGAQHMYYNQHTASLKPLEAGDNSQNKEQQPLGTKSSGTGNSQHA